MGLDLKQIVTPQSVPRDGHDRPLVIPRIGGKALPYTRTTTFIDCIEDKSTIADWKCRSVLLGAAAQPSILDAVRALDPETNDFKDRLNELAEEAARVAGAKDKADKGTQLHYYSELVDQGIALPESISRKDALIMASYAMGTADMEFSHIETFVVVTELGCAGTFDRRVYYSGPGPNGMHIEGWFIFDLKTGSIEYGGLKMASQLAAYSRGEQYDHSVHPAPNRYAVEELSKPRSKRKETAEWKEWRKRSFTAEEAAKAYSPTPEVNQDWGIIFHLPSDGSAEPQPYWADLKIGWEACLLAKTIRSTRSLKSKSLRTFADAA